MTLAQVCCHAARCNPVRRILVGFRKVSFDRHREIAVGQWGCSQSAVLALKLQMLCSAGDNLSHPSP